MRFDYYKIIATTSHVGHASKGNILLQGALTHWTLLGNNGKTGYYYKSNWLHFFFGSYVMALVFLYGGHVHLINTKKEWTGFFKRLFETFKKQDTIEILKEKKVPILQQLHLFGEKEIKEDIIELEKHVNKNKKKLNFRVVRILKKQKKKNKTKKRFLLIKEKKKIQKNLQKKKKKSLESFFKKKVSLKKPSITIHDSGFLPGSISNWTEHVRFSNRYLAIPKKYAPFFSQYKKLYEDFIRLKNQSIAFFQSKKKNRVHPIQKKKPDIIVVLNSSKEYGILFESFRQSLPVYGTVTTYTKKEWIDFPWNGNDTSLFSLNIWCCWITRIFQYVQLKRFQKKLLYLKETRDSETSERNKEGLFTSFNEKKRVLFFPSNSSIAQG